MASSAARRSSTPTASTTCTRLVPLQHVAAEGRLAVDLELVHVQILAVDLLHRVDHARMAREPREGLAVEVRREVGAHGVAALLADVLRAMLRIEARHLVGEVPDLFRREERREEEVAVLVEGGKLLGRELHGEDFTPRPCPDSPRPST